MRSWPNFLFRFIVYPVDGQTKFLVYKHGQTKDNPLMSQFLDQLHGPDFVDTT